MLKKVEEDQFVKFKESLAIECNDKYTILREKYIVIVLTTFLGNYFPMETYNSNFNEYCHQVIDSISLCLPEIVFFRKMVDFIPVGDGTDYICEYIKLYDETTDLLKCQLGPNIKKCLDASTYVKFQ